MKLAESVSPDDNNHPYEIAKKITLSGGNDGQSRRSHSHGKTSKKMQKIVGVFPESDIADYLDTFCR